MLTTTAPATIDGEIGDHQASPRTRPRSGPARAHRVSGGVPVQDGACARGRTDGSVAPAASETPASEQGSTSAPASRGRDRYIDTLRVLALGRVIAYHVTGWVLLPILFPSMGIMFALAGSLMAASLDRSPQNPWPVLRKRLRRMLPPLWALGTVLVTIMLVIGWQATEELGSEFSWSTILFWMVPAVDPPASIQGADWVIPLWYIRAYFWFVLTSPILLWCFRRWQWRTFAVPLVVLLGYGAGLVTLNGAEGDIVLDWAVFGACWILGFAHHDGLIRTIPMAKVLPVAAAFIGAGLLWTYLYPDPVLGYSISDIPVADGLYCLGFVIILLRIYPDFSWVARVRWLDLLISAMNQRAMTIYLWGNACIAAALVLLGHVPAFEEALTDGDLRGEALVLTLTWILIGLAVLAFGWVEDVAAKRPMQLLPLPRRGGKHAKQRFTSAVRTTTATAPRTPAHVGGALPDGQRGGHQHGHHADTHAHGQHGPLHRPEQLRPQAATS